MYLPLTDNTDNEHIMFDVEALGLDPHKCHVMEIAAVKFSFQKDEVKEFYQKVAWQSNKDVGRVIDQETLAWWLRDHEKLADMYSDMPNAYSIRSTLNRLNEWLVDACNLDEKNLYVWAKSTKFDIVLLESLYEHADLPVVWHYRNIMDARVLYALAGSTPIKLPVEEAHTALADCHAQIEQLRTSRQILQVESECQATKLGVANQQMPYDIQNQGPGTIE